MAKFGNPSVSGTATRLVPAEDRYNFTKLIIQPEGANIRVRWDGQEPTASVGHIVFQNGSLTIEGPSQVDNTWVIAQSGTATVNYTLDF